MGPGADDEPLFQVRSSPIHGRGGFAVRRIPKGTRIAEYVGERLTAEELDRRYEDATGEDGHTFLFHAGEDLYIDASSGGNDARFINHSCEPNCESEVEDDRVWIVAREDDNHYGRLGVLCGWRTQAHMAFDIPPQAFTPPPKVTSTVVHIEPIATPLPCEPDRLEKVTHAAFGQRRKMLRQSLKPIGGEALRC